MSDMRCDICGCETQQLEGGECKDCSTYKTTFLVPLVSSAIVSSISIEITNNFLISVFIAVVIGVSLAYTDEKKKILPRVKNKLF